MRTALKLAATCLIAAGLAQPALAQESPTLQKIKASGSIALGHRESSIPFSYYDDTKFHALKVDGVEPTAENVCSGKFNIWAYEHMYTAASPDDVTQAFIDYMLSDDVQGSLVAQTGYISISGMKVSRDVDGTVTKL